MPTRLSRYVPLLCAALLVTGCAAKEEPKAFPTVVTTLGAPTSAPAPTAKPSPSTKVSVAAVYPAQGKAYAEAVIAAWKAKNLTRLGDLTTAQVQEQLIEIPGPPNMTWTYVMCDGAAGSQYCRFTNADGHKLTLRLVNEKLGQAHAATEVKYEM